MELSTCIHRFFEHYLPFIRSSSEQTIKVYRDTYAILLPFLAGFNGIPIDALKVEHLTVEAVSAFLHHLVSDRHNSIPTQNLRLAAIKSFAKMLLFEYPESGHLAEEILSIPAKRQVHPPIGYLYPEEIRCVYNMIDLRKKDGFRDYCLLHLLYDTGARVSEIAALQLDHFDAGRRLLAIIGKNNHNRRIELWPKTNELLKVYITQYRTISKSAYGRFLFINQRGQAFTRHGIYRICKKYLKQALEPGRFDFINPAHSFRHARAINMIVSGESLASIQTRLGHESIQSAMAYLHIDFSEKRDLQRQLVQYAQAHLSSDPKIIDFIEGEKKRG